MEIKISSSLRKGFRLGYAKKRKKKNWWKSYESGSVSALSAWPGTSIWMKHERSLISVIHGLFTNSWNDVSVVDIGEREIERERTKIVCVTKRNNRKKNNKAVHFFSNSQDPCQNSSAIRPTLGQFPWITLMDKWILQYILCNTNVRPSRCFIQNRHHVKLFSPEPSQLKRPTFVLWSKMITSYGKFFI